MKSLRPYQADAITALYDYWKKPDSKHGIIVAPTGSGKSMILAALCKEICEKWPGTRIMILTHVRELLQQDYDELIGLWPEAPAGIFSAGLGRKEFHEQILVAGIQSIDKHVHKLSPPPEIVIVDEVHLIPRTESTRYNKAIKTLEAMYPHLRVVGLSATPYRLDSGWLHLGEGAIFDSIVYDIPVQMLIDQGYLSKLTVKSTAVKIETKGVKHLGKEFASGELEAVAMAGETTNHAIDDMVARGQDRKKWIVFACGLKHADQISQALDSHGITNAIISGDMAKSERDEIIENYKGNGIFELRCLISVNVLTTGFNCPQIDLLAMLRPTESCGLYVQMIGRGMRTAPGKENCLVLDYAGNTLRHGPIDAVDPDRKPGEGEGQAPSKTCPDCNEIIHAALRVCPVCGHEFPPAPPEIKVRPVEAPILKEHIEPEELVVDKTTYKLHTKQGKKNSVKVEYQIGMSWVCEWVFPEADTQWGVFYYEKFCKEAGLAAPFPKTAENFLCLCDAQAEKIWTIPDGKYTRVKKRVYREKVAPKYDDIIPF